MSTYELKIDGSSAEAGAERIVKSFESIKAASARMEGGVTAAANRMVAAFRQLSNVRPVSREAVDTLNSLSSSLSKFRGPSSAAVRNTTDFLMAMSKFSGLRMPSVAGLASFLNATAKYSGPTPGAGKNLQSLLRALSGFSGITGGGAKLNSFLSALGSFRGPTATAGRNVESLFRALGNFTGLPKGFASSSQAFIAFAAAVDKTTAAFRRLRSVSGEKIAAPSLPALPKISGGGGAGVRNLAKEYNYLESAILRTQSAINGLGGILAFKAIVTASNDILKIRAQLVAATGSTIQASAQFKYLQDTADTLGLEFVTLSRSYGLFLGSVKGSKTTVADAQRIFEGFAVAGRAMQLSTQDIDGVFRALGQIISKGKLQAEELRGQLGDRLPGAFARMAAALGISTRELDIQMKKGAISGQRLQRALLDMSDQLKAEFTPSAEAASKTVEASFNRLKNAFVYAASGLGQSGLNQGLIEIADGLRKILDSKGLAALLEIIGKLFKFVGDNANFFAAAVGGAAISATLKWTASTVGLIGSLSKAKDLLAEVRAGYTAASLATATKATGPVTQIATGASSAAAASGMNAYAVAANSAAVASTAEARAAGAATVSTRAAGVAAGVAAVEFDVLAAGSAAATGGLTATSAALNIEAVSATAAFSATTAAAEATSVLGGVSGTAAIGIGALAEATAVLAPLEATLAAESGLVTTTISAETIALEANAVAKGLVATGSAVLVPALAAEATASVAAAGGFSIMAAASAIASGAMAAMSVVMAALPWIALGIAVAAFIAYIISASDATTEAKTAMANLGKVHDTGASLLAAYNSYLDNNTSSLNANAIASRKATIAAIELNLAKAGAFSVPDVKYSTVKAGGDIPGTDQGGHYIATKYGAVYIPKRQVSQNGGGVITGADGKPISGQAYRDITTLAPRASGGSLQTRGNATSTDEYRARRTNQLDIGRRLNTPGAYSAGDQAVVQSYYDAENARLNAQSEVSRNQGLNKDKGFTDFYSVDQELLGTYNTSGGADAGATGNGKKKKHAGGGGAGRADEQDVRRAMESVRDLRREIDVTIQSIDELSGPAASAAANAARNAAVAQVNNFEDSFGTVQRAQKGIVTFASELKRQAEGTLSAVKNAQDIIDKAAVDPASVPMDKLQAAKELTASYSEGEIAAAQKLAAANVSGYKDARAAAIDYLTALQQIKAEKQKELEITKSLADIRVEIATKTGDVIPGTGGRKGVDMVVATQEGGRYLNNATLMQQALAEAVGVSAENYDAYVQKLYAAKKAQQDLNAQLEIADQLHKNEQERLHLVDQASLMQSGLNSRDVADTLHVRDYQRELIDKGIFSNDQINNMVRAEAEMVNLRRAAKDIEDQFSKVEQVSQDMADTIVGGFKDAIENGTGFLDAMKGIFKDLKRTLLDFVLYNPLKQFLQGWITNLLAPQQGGGAALTAASGQVVSTNQSGAGILGAIQSVTSFLGNAFGGTGATSSGQSIGPVDSWNASDFNQNQSSVGTSSANSTNYDPNGLITVTGQSARKQTPLQMGFNLTQPQNFSALQRLFQYNDKTVTNPDGTTSVLKGNLSTLKDGFKDIGSAFSGGGKGVLKSLNSLGKGIGKVAGVAFQAFAVYDTVRGLAKSLGLGDTGSGILGGAAAGFSVAGPVGAAIGAIIGGVAGHFSKSPRARADVIVGADGKATAGNTYAKSGGNLAGVTDAANGAGSIFSSIANDLGSFLKAGNYGTFGEAKKIKGDTKTFYSLTGQVDGKGRPKGTAGVDYLIGTPDQLNAFALKKQLQSGKFGGLDPVYSTIANNSTATSTDALSADLQTGKSYLNFIDQSKVISQLETTTQDLTKAYETLRRSSQGLGLDVSKLDNAFYKMKKRIKDDFNFGINQGILGITDPIMAEFNQLKKDYESSVRDANAVGGDLTKVEEYYGLQRAELIKKYMSQANNSIKTAADDLLRQLTATDSSPLAAQTIFNNAQSNYSGLKQQIMGGDYTNVDKLGQYSQDYLSAAQSLFASSSDFFNVFNTVTDFLKYIQTSDTVGVGTGTNPTDLPGLPTIAEIQQQIIDTNNQVIDSNGEIVTSTQAVGSTLVESNQILEDIKAAILANGYNYGPGLGGYNFGNLSTLSQV